MPSQLGLTVMVVCGVLTAITAVLIRRDWTAHTVRGAVPLYRVRRSFIRNVMGFVIFSTAAEAGAFGYFIPNGGSIYYALLVTVVVEGVNALLLLRRYRVIGRDLRSAQALDGEAAGLPPAV